MRLALVIVLVAVLTQILTRAARRFGLWHVDEGGAYDYRHHHHPKAFAGQYPRARHIRVLFSAPIRETWRESIVHILTQALVPRNLHVSVLLECTQLSDANLGELSSELRPFVRLVHARAPARTSSSSLPSDPLKRHRRLMRRFVKGDESLVVVLDHRVRLMRGWDAMICTCLEQEEVRNGDDSEVPVVLSAPAATRAGVPAFPTRRRRSDGVHVARGVARAFEGPAAAHALPSVCWCAEFTAGSPAALCDWPRGETSSAVGLTDHSGRRHVVPALPLLEADASLEQAYLDADLGCASALYGACERVGLTRDADDAERIRKFGSSRAARLAIEFS